jgi:(2Fe-2S) ferredoxin
MRRTAIDQRPRPLYLSGVATGDPEPFYDRHVFCCTNSRESPKASCGVHDADHLRGYLKDLVKEAGLKGMRVNSAGCLNRCDLGPVMVIYPEGTWYHYETRQDIEEIFETHIRQGGRVERLRLQTDR